MDFPRLTPPTARAYASSTWGADRSYRDGWHAGIDFPDTAGRPILAAAPGRVVYVDNNPNSYAGNWSIVDHGSGVKTAYMHAQRNLVSVGDTVARGQPIGLVGATGTSSSSPHVHFALALTPAALAAYASKFGRPSTGWGGTISHGTYAPAEALMDGATYAPKAREQAERLGVRFYGALGMSIGTMVLGLFIMWGGWELLTQEGDA